MTLNRVRVNDCGGVEPFAAIVGLVLCCVRSGDTVCPVIDVVTKRSAVEGNGGVAVLMGVAEARLGS